MKKISCVQKWDDVYIQTFRKKKAAFSVTGLRLFGFVCFLLFLVSGKGCSLLLWHSLDFSLTFVFASRYVSYSEHLSEHRFHYIYTWCSLTVKLRAAYSSL